MQHQALDSCQTAQHSASSNHINLFLCVNDDSDAGDGLQMSVPKLHRIL